MRKFEVNALVGYEDDVELFSKVIINRDFISEIKPDMNDPEKNRAVVVMRNKNSYLLDEKFEDFIKRV